MILAFLIIVYNAHLKQNVVQRGTYLLEGTGMTRKIGFTADGAFYLMSIEPTTFCV